MDPGAGEAGGGVETVGAAIAGGPEGAVGPEGEALGLEVAVADGTTNEAQTDSAGEAEAPPAADPEPDPAPEAEAAAAPE